MLAELDPPRLDTERSVVKFHDDTVNLELNHREQADWTVWADAGPGGAMVQTVLFAHEHFEESIGEDWPSEAVDFLRRVLCGQVVVEATLRGDEVLMVRRFVEDDDGTPLYSGWTAFLPIARFFVWRRKRTEVVRPTFL